MKLSIEIKYLHPQLKIGLENIKEAWLLSDIKIRLSWKQSSIREIYIITVLLKRVWSRKFYSKIKLKQTFWSLRDLWN